MRQLQIFRIAPLALVVITWPFFSPSANADVITIDVSHAFTFAPSGGVGSPVSFSLQALADAPPAGLLELTNRADIFGPAGGTASAHATSTGLPSIATAGSFATVLPFTFGGPVSGVLSSQGSVTADSIGTFFAVSMAAMSLSGGNIPTGTIDWRPELDHSMLGGFHWLPPGAERAFLFDPIHFTVTNLDTGAVVEGSLFNLSADFVGVGSWSWSNGVLSVDAAAAENFRLQIDMNSPFTIQHGTLELEVQGGVVTVAEGTGAFAGVLPSVGSPGKFSVPFSNDLRLDYDLGDFGGDPLDIQFAFDNSASIAVPEPSALVLLGTGLLTTVRLTRGRLRRLQTSR